MIDAGQLHHSRPTIPLCPATFPGNPVVPGVILLDHATAAVLAAHPG